MQCLHRVLLITGVPEGKARAAAEAVAGSER